MVITLKVEDNDGTTSEYNVFPCELTRELVEQHIGSMLDDIKDIVQVDNVDPKHLIEFVLTNFKFGNKVIFNDGLDDNEKLNIFTSSADIVGNFVTMHEKKNAKE